MRFEALQRKHASTPNNEGIEETTSQINGLCPVHKALCHPRARALHGTCTRWRARRCKRLQCRGTSPDCSNAHTTVQTSVLPRSSDAQQSGNKLTAERQQELERSERGRRRDRRSKAKGKKRGARGEATCFVVRRSGQTWHGGCGWLQTRPTNAFLPKQTSAKWHAVSDIHKSKPWCELSQRLPWTPLPPPEAMTL